MTSKSRQVSSVGCISGFTRPFSDVPRAGRRGLHGSRPVVISTVMSRRCVLSSLRTAASGCARATPRLLSTLSPFLSSIPTSSGQVMPRRLSFGASSGCRSLRRRFSGCRVWFCERSTSATDRSFAPTVGSLWRWIHGLSIPRFVSVLIHPMRRFVVGQTTFWIIWTIGDGASELPNQTPKPTAAAPRISGGAVRSAARAHRRHPVSSGCGSALR